MSKTGISWTDETWNPTVGCSKVSTGCNGCYALKGAWRMAHNPNLKIRAAYAGTVEKRNGKLQWTGRVNCLPDRLEQPLHWKKPHRIFVDSMSDLFHPDVPFKFIAKVWNTMFDCGSGDYCKQQHIFQILTKRPERALEFAKWMKANHRAMDYRNVWLGVSVEDQATANERIPILLQTPAAVWWVSMEPLLALTDIRPWLRQYRCRKCWDRGWMGDPSSGCPYCNPGLEWKSGSVIAGSPKGDQLLNWVIVGGESGPDHRTLDIDWIRQTVEQCKTAGVPVFVKQDSGPKPGQQGRIPDDLWIKEMPEVGGA
ncbi:MAG TPA: DUF5131 family protein [bacterium]|nr:DUF5131 family protein [bacterium]